MSQVIEEKEQKFDTLKNRSDFLRVAGMRQKWVTPAMIIQVLSNRNNDSEEVRVGYTASKKVGNAVQRNFAKRRMREVAKKVFPNKAKEGHYYVLIARREISEYSFNELIRDLKWALKRLHEGLDAKKGGAN